MTFLSQIQNEQILIVGFSYRTGLATANHLLAKGISISISDSKPESELTHLIKQLKGQAKNLFFGKQSTAQLNGIDRIILSPGVPRSIPLIQEAVKLGIPVTGEIELAYLLCQAKKIIGITGTDGKSTTTSLIYELLKSERKVMMGGNIGIPFISFVDKIDAQTYVLLELSSYQLEDIPYFKCDIAAVLNVAEDHLDRYNGFNHYLETKKNIFRNQNAGDIALLNYDDEHYQQVSQGIKARVYSISKENQQQSAYVLDNTVYFKNEPIASLANIKLQGIHNLENILAAVSIAKLVGISNQTIEKVLTEFKGLPHRNEYVDTVHGVDFINDTKGTTINAVKKSLLSQTKPVVLIMGGQDKGVNFAQLHPYIHGRVKVLVLYGEAREKIDQELQFSPTRLVRNLEEAFAQAIEQAAQKDLVLLSPGCTSFDQYQSYEKRGEHFIELVKAWKSREFKTSI